LDFETSGDLGGGLPLSFAETDFNELLCRGDFLDLLEVVAHRSELLKY
jgi:hypothetical protein